VGDLIAAQTLDQARVAAQQMGGAMSRRVAPAKEALLQLIAVLEAGMDFASGELDDVDVVPASAIAEGIAEARGPLVLLMAGFQRGQMLRRGAAIALVGRPNAGKSSLFNRLLERERAIVTAVAGTTRDTVEESVAIGGVPVRLIDTAGLRVGDDAVDEAEALGIARSREALADADLVLVVEDVTAPLSIDRELVAGRPHLVVRNKIDLVEARGGDGIATSAVTGEGIEALRAAILRELGAEGALADAGAIHTLRQQEAVSAAVAALDAAAEANAAGQPHEILLMDLHAALGAVDALTGTTTTEEILGRIFAAFCIGK
jgi:tRNA modification GTPase